MSEIFQKIAFVVFGFFICGAVELSLASSVSALPSHLIVTDRYPITKNQTMQDGGIIEISGIGSIVRDPDTVGVKLRHPQSATKKAKIDITAGVGGGDSSRLTSLFNDRFANIARFLIPYISEDLITTDTATPASGGWKGIVGVTKDDDDGLHMFVPAVATYYNSLPTKSMVVDMADPQLPDGIDTSPNLSTKNTVLKVIVLTLDPTDSSLPEYDAVNSPCGVETVDTEKVYHVPFGIAYKDPSLNIQSPAVDIRGLGTVLLTGDNSYLGAIVYVRRGVKAVITHEDSMPQSNITVGVEGDVGASTLTFPTDLESSTTFTMPSGTTLTMAGSENSTAEIVVPNFVTLDVRNASKSMKAGSHLIIEPGGRVNY